MRTAAVVTVSDSRSRGDNQDLSGPAIQEALAAAGFAVVARVTVPDEQVEIEDELRRLCGQARLVVTTGGTGIAPRDVTPEATRAVGDRLIEGFGELMRSEGQKTARHAALSRAIAVTRGASLIVNLPGSPKGARSSLDAVLPIIPHALDLLAGMSRGHD